jgi:hypothetical protein
MYLRGKTKDLGIKNEKNYVSVRFRKEKGQFLQKVNLLLRLSVESNSILIVWNRIVS